MRFVQKFLRATRHAQVLGIRALRAEEREIELELPYADALIGNPLDRSIHGGAVTTLLDMAGGVVVACALLTREASPTLDLRIDYLHGAEPDRSVFAVARAYHLSRHVVFVDGFAYQDDAENPIARCAATFARIDPSRRRYAEQGVAS